MRFIEHGPDISDLLWRSHEDGDVVLFCGAGVSRSAGLPDFKGLIDQLYQRLGTDRSETENEAELAGRYDGVVDLLDIRLQDRGAVRKTICGILTPKDYSAPGVLDTHKALLTLGRAADGNLRLVTTNYDRLFMRAGLQHPCFSAPLLPIPKRPRWNGLVHLHGLMPEGDNPAALNNMVVSSGDFGLAYLTERWASRFVTELFRSYVVCFVGYSIDDPVLRYMVDAISADQQLGEASPKVYAFAPYTEGNEAEADRKWRAKKVIPILYEDGSNHEILHQTLRQWAADYRDGLNGKSATIRREATSPPSDIKGDDQVDRVLWAISEPSGAPALTFAMMEPPPDLAWLRVFSEPRYGFDDLPQFGIQPTKRNRDPRADARLRFSLLKRPSQYESASWMRLVSMNSGWLPDSQLDRVMTAMAFWLAKHIHNPELVEWVIKGGARLHPTFIECIERFMTEKPDLLPPPVRTIWRFLCAGLVVTSENMTLTLTDWAKKLKQDGNTAYVREEFCELLSPRFHFGEPKRWPWDQPAGSHPARVKDYIHCDATLACGQDITHLLSEIKKNPNWEDLVRSMLTDFTGLLRRTMLLLQDLGEATAIHDFSYIMRPQIADHEQNRDFHAWVKLVELCRDSLLLNATSNPDLVRTEINRWAQIEFPIFKRLAFFGATAANVLDAHEELELLISSDGWWLWSSETQREAIRLLVHVAPRLDAPDAERLCVALLTGPPVGLFGGNEKKDEKLVAVEYMTWLRLTKAKAAGAKLTKPADSRLTEISKKYPKWEIEEDESDEFSSYIRVGGGIGLGRGSVPRRRRELVEFFLAHPDKEGDWFDVCRKQSWTAVATLLALAKQSVWRADLWQTALQALSEEKLCRYTYRFLLPALKIMPNEPFKTGLGSIAWWLRAAAKVVKNAHDDDWLSLIDRVIEESQVEYVLEENEDPVDAASAHPVGEAIQGLMEWWYRTKPKAGTGLDSRIATRLERVLDNTNPVSPFARMMAARHLFALHLVDPAWAKQHLLPLFDWDVGNTASSMWAGYLLNPRIDAGLLMAFKKDFLKVGDKFPPTSDYIGQYGALLMDVALEIRGVATAVELRGAFKLLSPHGLHQAAFLMSRSISSVGADDPAKAEDYWINRVQPVLKEIWPKDAALRTDDTSAELAEVCLATGKYFKEAFSEIKGLLITVPHSYILVKTLAQSDFPKTYPREVLELLGLIFDISGPSPYDELRSCLKKIRDAEPMLTDDVTYKRLSEYLQKSTVAG